MIRRLCLLPAQSKESFFLWGPRQTGKTTLLRERYPEALRIDLLRSDVMMKYAQRPFLLRHELDLVDASRLVIVDEVQRVPALLDEIHALIEERGRVFGLCGSSARKVRRSHANLLGGRAVRFELFGLVSAELGEEFDLVRMLNNGPLPRHYLSASAGRLLNSYVTDYLREEVFEESLVRSLPIFSDFLRVAALADTEVVVLANIARECGVSGPTVREHYQILVDTLLGTFLPAYTVRQKRRVIRAPKFYFRDVGVVNALARRGKIEPGSFAFGKAFESWVFHELSAHRAYHDPGCEISYWRTSGGQEVDFVIGDARVAIEAKGTTRVASQHLSGLRAFREAHSKAPLLIVVCMEETPRRTDDGIVVLPAIEFARRLWSGKLWQEREY